MAAADITERMRVYYAQRAAEYERIYLRPERQAGLRALEAALPALFAGRRVLELACGTGWWTPHGARDARSWLATDLNPETMAIAQAKPLPPCVRFAVADAYTLAGLDGERFDAAFSGCWWSHVPLARLPAWLARLHGRLPAGATVVMLDNRFVPGNSTPLSRHDADGNTYQQCRLDDGSQHEVLKNYPTVDQVRTLLGAAARDLHWTEHPHHWVLRYSLA